jgi:hypothetical protein
MRRRPVLVILGLAVGATILVAAPAHAGAAPGPIAGAGGRAVVAAAGQEPDAPADDGTGGSEDGEPDEPLPGDDIIPEPNSGRAPEEAGDRGGALQVLLLVLLVAGVGGIAVMIVRESRRSRAARAETGR